MKVSMYDTLLELPLFQGLTKENITSIIEKVKMGFHKYETRQNIAMQDAKCNSLIFILDGSVAITTTDEKHRRTRKRTIYNRTLFTFRNAHQISCVVLRHGRSGDTEYRQGIYTDEPV